MGVKEDDDLPVINHTLWDIIVGERWKGANFSLGRTFLEVYMDWTLGFSWVPTVGSTLKPTNGTAHGAACTTLQIDLLTQVTNCFFFWGKTFDFRKISVMRVITMSF